MANPGVQRPIFIIGAGPTGLGAAHRLEELGRAPVRLFEQASGVGGLAASPVDTQGFTWDLGGHVQFSHYRYYDDVLDRVLPDQWLWHDRESWVWLKSRFIPYPYQNNIHRLDPEDARRSFEGLQAAKREREATAQTPPQNFAEWMMRMLGPGICSDFMRPYNEKVWGVPVEQMSTTWLGERVAVPDLERIQRNLRENRDDVSWGPNNRFRFPLRGGTGAIWSAVAAGLRPGTVVNGVGLDQVDLKRKTLQLTNGERLEFGALVSTIPLDVLSARCEGLSASALAASKELRYSSTHVVGVGLKGPTPEALRTKGWMYFPEPQTPYYRVTVFSNYSPNHVPAPGHWSLMAEVCETAYKPAPADVRQAVVAGLRADGLIDATSEVVSVWNTRLEHGYPTPFVGRDEVLQRILPELEEHGVFSRGRFGGWKYEVANQDHSFMQGVELADRLVSGAPETTFPNPNLANSGVFLKGR